MHTVVTTRELPQAHREKAAQRDKSRRPRRRFRKKTPSGHETQRCSVSCGRQRARPNHAEPPCTLAGERGEERDAGGRGGEDVQRGRAPFGQGTKTPMCGVGQRLPLR